MTPMTSPPRLQRGIGERAHQPDAPAAVDDADAARGKARPDRACQLDVGRVTTRTRAAEDADPLHQNPSSDSCGAIRRAARARCEIACFSAGLHSPRVRPPGGSVAGSKMGSYPNPSVPRGAVAIRPRHVPRDRTSGRPPRAPARSGCARARTQTYRAPRAGAGNPRSAVEQLRVVVGIGGLSPAYRRVRTPGPAVEGIDLQPRIIGQRRQARSARPGPGLDRGVRLERGPVLDRVVGDADVVEGDEVGVRQVEQLDELAQLVCRAGGDEQPPAAHRLTVARTAAWASNRLASPASARSSRPTAAARSNGLPSAVPCSSTYAPASVPTTLKSTSAWESSE